MISIKEGKIFVHGKQTVNNELIGIALKEFAGMYPKGEINKKVEK